MKQAINFMRGNVRVKVETPYPERLVNLCAQNDLDFWDLERADDTVVSLSMHLGGFRRLRELAGRAGIEILNVKKTGMPVFLWRLRKRYVLIAGALVTFIVVWVLSLFVLEIDVYGNKTVSTQRILAALEQQGVGIGTFGPSVVSERLSNMVILEIPELSWIAINVRGSHADVLVRERVEKPELLDENAPTMVYALKSGIITKMSVMEGQNTCAVGDTVQAGDVLVTGIMDSIASGRRMVHAMAEITARTWYELSAQTVLDTSTKAYTGQKQTKTALIIAGLRINLYANGGISFDCYDKITTQKTLRLPTGNALPIVIVRDTYEEYVPQPSALSVLDAVTHLQQRLLDRLDDRAEGGEIVSTAFTTSVKDGAVTVSLTAECLEQIASERPFTPEELAEGTRQEITEETET